MNVTNKELQEHIEQRFGGKVTVTDEEVTIDQPDETVSYEVVKHLIGGRDLTVNVERDVISEGDSVTGLTI